VTTVALSAVSRSDFGKGAARRIRRDGNIPAVIYGDSSDLLHVAIPTHELDLALRKPRVVLSVTVDGTTHLVKPRDIQRDPVKRTLEHIDLVVIGKAEAADRAAMAQAIQTATEAAVQALEEAVAQGENPAEAAEHAVADAEHKAEEYADANAHAAEVEAAEAADDAAASEPAAE